MSNIFKTRKIPKHLIIQEESDVSVKRSSRLPKVLFWLLVIMTVTWGFLQLR